MDRFGYAVALDNEQMVVGAAGESSQGQEAGAAYRFNVTSGGTSRVTKLVASDPSANATFGAAVAAQTNEVLVGAVTAANVGAAYVLPTPATAAPALGSHPISVLIALALGFVLIALRRRGVAATVVAACVASSSGCARNEAAPPPTAAATAAALTQDTLTFTPARDAAVRGSAPDTNFGSNTVLRGREPDLDRARTHDER